MSPLYRHIPGEEGPLPPCPSGVFWIVEPGDTYWVVSRKTGIPVEVLMDANPHLDPMNLQVGDKICIPEFEAK